MNERRRDDASGPVPAVAGSLSEAERMRRRKAVDYATGSVRLEGFVLDPEIKALNQRYIDGELSSEQLTAAIKWAVG